VKHRPEIAPTAGEGTGADPAGESDGAQAAEGRGLATLERRPPPTPATRVISPDDLVESWLAGRPETTARAYRGCVDHFARFSGWPTADAIPAFLRLDRESANAVVFAYRDGMKMGGRSPATIAQRLSALRSLLRRARTIGLVQWTLDVDSPRVEPYRDTRGPGADGWQRIKRHARHGAAGGKGRDVRDYAIVCLARGNGLRRAEITGLDLADVELGLEPAVWVLGKGRDAKERLTIAASTAEALRAWMDLRGDWPGPLFYRLDRAAMRLDLDARGRLTGRAVGDLVPQLGRKAGITQRVRPHGLRHAGITAALEATGGDVRKVQRFSRHRDPKTVLLYDDARVDLAGEVARLIDEG
jgi:integrase/recombinase XerC